MPLPGLVGNPLAVPRLAPWATIFRPCRGFFPDDLQQREKCSSIRGSSKLRCWTRKAARSWSAVEDTGRGRHRVFTRHGALRPGWGSKPPGTRGGSSECCGSKATSCGSAMPVRSARNQFWRPRAARSDPQTGKHAGAVFAGRNGPDGRADGPGIAAGLSAPGVPPRQGSSEGGDRSEIGGAAVRDVAGDYAVGAADSYAG